MNVLKVIGKAIKVTMASKLSVFIFIVVAGVTLFLFTLIPVYFIEGNDIGFQLSIFTVQEIILLSFLSLLYALYIAMYARLFRSEKKVAKLSAGGVGGGVGTLFAGVVGSAACSSCLAPLFALLGIGFGGILFVLEYRLYFIVVIVALILVAIYFTSKRITSQC